MIHVLDDKRTDGSPTVGYMYSFKPLHILFRSKKQEMKITVIFLCVRTIHEGNLRRVREHGTRK